MFEIRHKHDTVIHEDFGYDYTDKLFDNTLSKFLLSNDKLKEFTGILSKIVAMMFDSTESVKNMFYFTHNKYYSRNGK